MWIVNGVLSKIDYNFYRKFHFNEVKQDNLNARQPHPEGKIYVGSHPELEQDIKALKDIQVVICLQTKDEKANRTFSNTQSKALDRVFLDKNIEVVNFPLDDVKMNEVEYSIKVFEICKTINNISSKSSKNVLVHCTTGISRAPTVILTYLCLYKKTKTWYNIPKSEDYLKRFHPICHPNLKVVQKTLK